MKVVVKYGFTTETMNEQYCQYVLQGQFFFLIQFAAMSFKIVMVQVVNGFQMEMIT